MLMQPADELLTTAQVADLAKVSRQTVWRWARSGVLPAVHPGPKLWRFRRSDVEKLLEPSSSPDQAAS
jgi:excisionase family DNA binding protein